MKKMKRLLTIILCVIVTISCLAVGVSASNDGSFSIVCYNVAGLPNLKYILGKEGGVNVEGNQKLIGGFLNSDNYDIIATQEDFGYNAALYGELTSYPYRTIHTGGVPGGDGMNIYAKTPVYNETRTKWNSAYGVINDGADEMTPKGILYCVVEIADGVYADLYDIHADAYDGEGSIAAREDNFNQLADLILSKPSVRPVIVVGDFNISVSYSKNSNIAPILYEKAGLKDAWIEVNNGGNYTDFSYFIENFGFSWGEKWGKWDSVEKVLYKNGGGVELEPTECSYKYYRDENGTSLSDHASISAVFTVTKTADFVENTETLTVTKKNSFDMFIKKVFVIFTDLFKALAHLDEALAYLKG
ncbi:MAG: endonuclease/exonuclease/phosphatase family protein [Acutalibacteraceae bacterium]